MWFLDLDQRFSELMGGFEAQVINVPKFSDILWTEKEL